MAADSALVPALFLHIQKTAGTSLVGLAFQHYGVAKVKSHGDFIDRFLQPGASLPVNAARGTPEFNAFFSPESIRERVGGIPFVSGHFGYAYASALRKGRYAFTFLREPMERVLSFYYFCRGRNAAEFKIYRLAQEASLDEFLKLGLGGDAEVQNYLWNNQAWQLAYGFGNPTSALVTDLPGEKILDMALRNLQTFDHVGLTETFEQDRDVVLRALRMKVPAEKIVDNATPNRPTRHDLPRQTLALLEELTSLDRIVYEAARSGKNFVVR